MDLGTVAAAAAPLLAELIPVLTGLGESAAKSVAENFGSRLGADVYGRVSRSWERLWPVLQADPVGAPAVRALLDGGADDRKVGELESALRRAVEAHPELAADLQATLRSVPPHVLHQIGNRYDVGGHHNTVQSGHINFSVQGPAQNVRIGNDVHLPPADPPRRPRWWQR